MWPWTAIERLEIKNAEQHGKLVKANARAFVAEQLAEQLATDNTALYEIIGRLRAEIADMQEPKGAAKRGARKA